MRAALNQYIPFDAITRWWYILVAGPAIGLILRRAFDFRPIRVYYIRDDAGKRALTFYTDWKDDLLLATFGFLLAVGLTWILEEIYSHNSQDGH